MSDWTLQRDTFGHLVLHQNGLSHAGVVPMRAFPLAAPTQGISLVSREGHELAWIIDLAELPAETRQLVEAELATREFIPVIRQLLSVSSFATPSTWRVGTDRGETDFILRGEEDIRLLGNGRLLIADSHGIQFLVEDIARLDRTSRKLLDRFL